MTSTSFLLRVSRIGTNRGIPTLIPFTGTLERAKQEAENLLAPEGIAEVEVFQRIENGRLRKEITSNWTT